MPDAAAPPSHIVFDDIEVDVAGRRLLKSGREVALEPKAFEVLLLMLQQPGKALAREELLDAVWGHRHVTPGVLNRVVVLLRRALGDDSNKERYIQTARVGYRPTPPPPCVVGGGTTADATTRRDEVPPLDTATVQPHRRTTDPGRAIAGGRWPELALAWLLAGSVGGHGRAVSGAGHARVSEQRRPASAATRATSVLAVLPLRALGSDRAAGICRRPQ
jgi:DNA-binding winged helix-turn-helix (wHTH) protein